MGIPRSVDAQIPYIIWNRTIRNGPSTSVDFQPGIENTFLLHPPLVESTDAELADTVGRLYISWKPLPVSACVSNPVVQGSPVFLFPFDIHDNYPWSLTQKTWSDTHRSLHFAGEKEDERTHFVSPRVGNSPKGPSVLKDWEEKEIRVIRPCCTKNILKKDWKSGAKIIIEPGETQCNLKEDLTESPAVE